MRYLTIALTKGRLAKKTLELLEKIGITCEEMKDPDSRKLIFANEELKLKFFLAERAGCAHLCGVRCRRYRHRRRGHDPGGTAENLRGVGSWASENAGCASAARKRPRSFLKHHELHPGGHQVPQYRQRLFL